VTLWGDFQIWDKLDEIMEWLSNLDFVRCHNSYIVYLPAVREMEKGAFLLTEGIKITISRSYGKAAKAAFMRWALAQRF
ncbi:MAG TPA: LytTR family transcriptional regulator DNA-binding domain-containing protein, partial [Candidatus Blautia pullicola]|nr:LytTR family transcriptional regulator DNA-binding domain-containing protein [Candidatus Blautia pullicola]